MKESDLNAYITSNLQKIGFVHKIADPPKVVATTVGKNPFDHFGINPYYIFYTESKLIKGGYSAFSFSSIREHQIDNLVAISTIRDTFYKEIADRIISCIVLGVYIPRKELSLFFFDIRCITNLIRDGFKSVSKKDLLKLKESEMYIPMTIKDKTFDTSLVSSKIIRGL